MNGSGMDDDDMVHASTVAIAGRAVMIMGASGSGKSDLALRLIDRGAMLVSDDYTRVRAVDGRVVGAPPATIAGRIEVRGLGVLDMPYATQATVALAVRLGEEDRMPEEAWTDIAGVRLPVVSIDPRPASAPIKVELALAGVAS
jgi:serine kinase of HPr protein (carbohydrate metabolism regulator)